MMTQRIMTVELAARADGLRGTPAGMRHLQRMRACQEMFLGFSSPRVGIKLPQTSIVSRKRLWLVKGTPSA